MNLKENYNFNKLMVKTFFIRGKNLNKNLKHNRYSKN